MLIWRLFSTLVALSMKKYLLINIILALVVVNPMIVYAEDSAAVEPAEGFHTRMRPDWRGPG